MGLPTTEDLDKGSCISRCSVGTVSFQSVEMRLLLENPILGIILSESTAVEWFHTIDGTADRTEALPRPTVETHDWYRE